MSARIYPPPVPGDASAVAPWPIQPLLVKRRHVDLMRVCGDGCRRHAPR
jgi:hypothetical protein